VEQQPEVIVVGGGQAGLTAGYYLTQAGISHLILDANARVGSRGGGAGNRSSSSQRRATAPFPGLAFPGDPERFPGKDEVADYLEDYARTFELSIRHSSPASSLERLNAGYRINTASTDHQVELPRVRSGDRRYRRPPASVRATDRGEPQRGRHPASQRRLRDPDQIPDQEVLVVGAAKLWSGDREDLSESHRVRLSRGSRLPRLPRRILGRSLHFWADNLGLIGAPFDSWRGRTQRGDLLVGKSLRQLARRHGSSFSVAPSKPKVDR